MNAGCSPIPSRSFLQELEDDDFRKDFVADHLRTRIALLIRALREQRGWSQAELGRRLGKPQSVVSRLEDPDYGKVTLQTLLEVAAAFGLPLYIDLPNWDEWFRLMEDMSRRNMKREEFNVEHLAEAAEHQGAFIPLPSAEATNIAPPPEQPLSARENVRISGIQTALNSSSSPAMKSVYVISLKDIPAHVSTGLDIWSSGLMRLLQPAVDAALHAYVNPEGDVSKEPDPLTKLLQKQSPARWLVPR